MGLSLKTNQAHFLANPFSASPSLCQYPFFLVPGECMNLNDSPGLREWKWKWTRLHGLAICKRALLSEKNGSWIFANAIVSMCH